jgi:dienelactone hydrolase
MEGYRRYSHEDDRGVSYHVHTRGTGPPVIVIHEMAGISPELRHFADRLVKAEFSVHLPELIGRPGGPMRMLVASVRVCVSAEFTKLAWGRTSPVVTWLRSLAREIHDDRRKVGVVGMCLTGGFALAMAVDPRVVAPVVAHPSLPLGLGSRRRRDLGLDAGDLAKLKERDDLRILGVRFTGDGFAPKPRFERMESEFRTRFACRDVKSGRGSPYGLPWWEHSVLCNRRMNSDRPQDVAAREELTRVADEVIDFLKAGLAAPETSSPSSSGS